MTDNFWKLASASALALSLMAAPVAAQEAFSDYDADESADIDEEEFGAGGWDEADVFGEWDEDDDDALSRDEFDAGVFGGYDADDSGTLDEEEFGAYGDDIGEEGFWDI